MKMIRDKRSTHLLGQQFMPQHPQFLTKALIKATQDGIGTYILIDCDQSSEDFHRVRNFIWPEHNRNSIFLPQ